MKSIKSLTKEELKDLSKQDLIDRGKEIKEAIAERMAIKDSTSHSPDFFQAVQHLELLDRMLHDVITTLGFDPNKIESIGRK